MIDLAQILQNAKAMVPAAKYTTANGIRTAAVAIDTKDFVRFGRSLVIVNNEATTALTVVTIQHSADGVTYTDVDAEAITHPKTGAALALGNLNANTFQAVALDLNRCKRYLKIYANVDPTTASGAAISVLFLSPVRETAAS